MCMPLVDAEKNTEGRGDQVFSIFKLSQLRWLRGLCSEPSYALGRKVSGVTEPCRASYMTGGPFTLHLALGVAVVALEDSGRALSGFSITDSSDVLEAWCLLLSLWAGKQW